MNHCPTSSLAKAIKVAVVLLGFVVYFLLFFTTALPELHDADGQKLSRIDLLLQLLLRPDEWLFPVWFGDPPQFTFADRIPVLCVATVIIAWAAVAGWILLKVFRMQQGLSRLECFLFSMALGLNVLSTWMLIAGLCGVMSRTATIIVPALLTGIAALFLARNTKKTDVVKANQTAASQEIVSPGWLWLMVPFALVIILSGMLPPMDFDAREYHFQAPKEFFQLGRIVFLPHNVYANMPAGTEMLSLLAMIVANDWLLGALAGKTVIAITAPLTALALYAAGQRLFSTTAGIIAALAYISVPWIVSVASGGFVESVLAYYSFLAIYSLMLKDSRTWPELLLAGYLAGAAAATKYPALLFVVVPLAIYVIIRKPLDITTSKSIFVVRGRNVACFLFAVVVACGLWYGKNWAQTGNPTYPLLYSVFDGKSWNADKDRQWTRVHRAEDFSARAMLDGFSYVFLRSPWLSPLVVPLAAMSFAGKWRRLAIILAIYVFFVLAGWWLLTHRIDRFWLPVMPVLSLLAGVGACWNSEAWWRKTLAGLLAIVLFVNFLVSSMGSGNSWFVPLDRLRAEIVGLDPWHAFFNQNPPQGILLCVGDAAVFDFTIPVLYNTCFDDCIFEQLVRNRSPEEVRQAFKSRNITNIYVNWSEIARYRRSYGFTDFVQPEVLDNLVKQGILKPLPPIANSPNRAYQVR